MYRIFLTSSLLLVTSCNLMKKPEQSQCDSEFVRESVVSKTKDMLSAKFKPESIDVTLGKPVTVETVNGENKCQTEMTIKATKVNYKAKSVAELGD